MVRRMGMVVVVVLAVVVVVDRVNIQYIILLSLKIIMRIHCGNI